VCEDPPPAEIALGSTTSSEVEDRTRTRCFWVEVPDGFTSLTFELTGLAADLNLYIGYGFLVTVQYNMGEFWQSVEDGTADEAVAIRNPEMGPYFVKVGIAGLPEPSPFLLSVRTEPEMTAPVTGAALPSSAACAPPAAELTLGSEITSEIVGRDQPPEARRYFCVLVAGGLPSISIELTELTGDLDLFVRGTLPTIWTDRRRGGSERAVVIDNPEPGPYHIDVAGAYPGASSPFTLKVTAP
jgi:hypothetical protein